MKSELLATMSHELRTTLNAIIGFSELLKDGIVEKLSPEPQEYIVKIYDSGRHLLDLIIDILDLSKVETASWNSKLMSSSRPLLENSLSMLREKTAKHSFKLLLTIETGPDIIYNELRKLKQRQRSVTSLKRGVRGDIIKLGDISLNKAPLNPSFQGGCEHLPGSSQSHNGKLL